MKKLIPLFLLVASVTSLFATHNHAGEIIYQQTGEDQIEATIITYTKLSSVAADRDSLYLCWGDGLCEFVYRVNGPNNEGEILGNNVKMNHYTASHTYPELGVYTLALDDPNRSDGILNVNFPNSGNIMFSLRTQVYLLGNNPAMYNSSPVLLQAPIDIAFEAAPFMHTPNAFDIEGDSIAYELIAPVDVQNYEPVTNINPGPDNNIDMNAETGLLIWDAPQQPGMYVITYAVRSYRNGQLVGEVIRDMLIDVLPVQLAAPDIEINGITNNETILSVTQGDTVRLEIEAVDPEMGNSVFITATSGLFDYFSIPATFSSEMNGNTANATFEWIVRAEHLRAFPYQLAIKAENDVTDHPASQIAVVRFRTVDFVSSTLPEPEAIALRLLPNFVTNGQLVVEYEAEDFSEFAYTIFSSTGKALRSGYLFAGRTNLELHGLPKGVYYFNTEIKGQQVSKAFVIGR